MMSMAVHKIFQHLIEKLYQSGLHFHLSETPFSAQILIRKKLLKDRTGSPFSDNCTQDEKLASLKNKISELQKNVEESNEIIDTLENKVDKAEATALKVYEEKTIEVETLKNALNKCNEEASKLKKELEKEKKIVKEKENFIRKLNHKCDNLTLNIKNAKSELNKVKTENKKLAKNRTKSQPTSDCVLTSNFATSSNQEISDTDLNQNVPPDDLQLLSCSASSTIIVPPNTSPRTSSQILHEKQSCSSPSVKETTHAWATTPSGHSTPPRQSGIQAPSSHSPCPPPGFPAEPSSQPARAKCVLSEQVQEIVKEGKVDFEKLLEAVRNDDFFNCRSENSAEEEDNYDNHDYENYPDEYWEML